VGAVIISFIVFLMMNQRKKDFGLIKAAGCPNSLVFSYFLVELLILAFVGCLIGVIFGFLADFALAGFGGFQVSQEFPNLWLGFLVFVIYFLLAIAFGTKPLRDAARLSPIEAMSPIKYFGLIKTDVFKPISKFAFTIRISLRSLYRQQSATIRIVFFLSLVFVLLTVAFAGSMIANDTTKAWLEEAVDMNTIVIGKGDMCNQYQHLLSKFSGTEANESFEYLDQDLLIQEADLQKINSTVGIAGLDPRLVWKGEIQEIVNFTIDPDTLATISVGDDREGNSLIVGIEPEKVFDRGFLKGRFLKPEDELRVVVGDSLAQELFSKPFSQSLKIEEYAFGIVGICVDPINNGRVVYILANSLRNITGLDGFNIVLARMGDGVNREARLNAIEERIKGIDSELTVLDLKETMQTNLKYLSSLWSSVIIVSIFSLIPAAFCLAGYLLLSIEEQRKEFGILRAVGAKPKTVMAILSIQSLVILISSWAVGTSLGIIVTLLILVPQPTVTISTVLITAAGIVGVLLLMFIMSLYAARRFAKKPILESVGQIIN
jgi:ABC-type antimicrobial peptide transport system permease subunit